MSVITPSQKSSGLLPNLATALFYVAGFALLGLMLMYVISRRSLHPLFNLGYASNYWAIPLLITASWLRIRRPEGWWLGMMMGGVFFLAGYSHVFGLMFVLARGTFELEALSIPNVSRFIFGVVALCLLSRPSVIGRMKPKAALDSPDTVRLIAASGFILGLYWAVNLLLSSIFWASLGGFSLQGFLFPFSAGWTVLPVVATIALFPIGKVLLHGKVWGYFGALAVWCIAFAWSLVDGVVMVSKIVRFGALGMWFESPLGFLGIPVGALLLSWLLRSDTLVHVGLEPRAQKKLALGIVVGAVVLISVAKGFDVPVLSEIFLF